MGHRPEDYLKQGNEFFKKGEFDKAIIHYTEAIRYNRDYASAYYNRSKAYEKKGDYEKASEDYDQAIYLNPDYAKENSSGKNSKTASKNIGQNKQKVATESKRSGDRNISRTRIDIQKDVNIYRGDLESKNLDINSPLWDDSQDDPRYHEIVKARDETALKLLEFEKELAMAKARGEKGRTKSEIIEEISDRQSKVDSYRSILNTTDENSMQWVMSYQFAQLLQCQVNSLQIELREAVK